MTAQHRGATSCFCGTWTARGATRCANPADGRHDVFRSVSSISSSQSGCVSLVARPLPSTAGGYFIGGFVDVLTRETVAGSATSVETTWVWVVVSYAIAASFAGNLTMTRE